MEKPLEFIDALKEACTHTPYRSCDGIGKRRKASSYRRQCSHTSRMWPRILPHSEVFPFSVSRRFVCSRIKLRSLSACEVRLKIDRKPLLDVAQKSHCPCCLEISNKVGEFGTDSTIRSNGSTTSLSSDVEEQTQRGCPPSPYFPVCESGLLITPLLNRYREKLHFVMFPAPEDAGIMSCYVRIDNDHMGRKSFSLVVRDARTNGREDTPLLEAYVAESEEKRMFLRKTRNKRLLMNNILYDIVLGGTLQTNVGRITLKNSKAITEVRSFRKGLDHINDIKGKPVKENFNLSEANLHPICTVANKFKLGKGKFRVNLDGVIEADEWDGMQSITGYYGTQQSWPYKDTQNGLESVHRSLFNEQSRSLDFLGRRLSNFTCSGSASTEKLTCKSEGVNQATYLKAKRTGDSEYLMQFSWPLSPVQALGLFISMSH